MLLKQQLRLIVNAFIKVYFSGDATSIFSKKENVLYLGNHQSTGKLNHVS